ncbi:hypothetical protein ACXYN8_02510 [Altererythrobacter sp. CAU 1778]
MIYLLAAILIVLLVGLGFTVAILYDIRANQNREAALVQYLHSVFGEPIEGDAARLMSDLREFHRDIRQGFYPNLRRDDWYPKKADIARWEAREMRQAYCDD